MATSQSQANKVYAEIVGSGYAAGSQAQKVYSEVISSGFPAKAQVMKVYAEVITAIPGVGGQNPVICCCT